jgi:hypothetical protein
LSKCYATLAQGQWTNKESGACTKVL